jgi:hypothetical protein
MHLCFTGSTAAGLPYRCFTVLAWPLVDGRYTGEVPLETPHYDRCCYITTSICTFRTFVAADPGENRSKAARASSCRSLHLGGECTS